MEGIFPALIKALWRPLPGVTETPDISEQPNSGSRFQPGIFKVSVNYKETFNEPNIVNYIKVKD